MNDEEFEKTVYELCDKDEFVQLEAQNKIASLGSDAVSQLNEIITTITDSHVKLEVAKLLSDFNDVSSIDTFIKLLYDPNKWVRRESSSALTKYGEEVIDPLLIVLDDENWRARGAAAWVLGNLGDERSLDALLVAIEDSESFVRSGAVFGLGKIGGPKSIIALKKAAEYDESSYVRANAIKFLEDLEN
ncbi:MAG: HEAT repeat domain-containing protein [Methanobacteriaceae archaeon]|nr:HEAT repeat domain-containing protein [Methanobacteriaceae archaeon]